jgi:hypothetical protein
MPVAVRRALEARARLRIEGVATERQVDAAIAAAGLDLREDRPYGGRVQGRLFRDTVCVRRDLWPDQRRVVKAHELGHHALGHAEGGFYVRAADGRTDAEVDAQVYAWTLLIGRPAATLDGLTAQMQAASAAGLPVDFLCAVVSILAQRLLGRGA